MRRTVLALSIVSLLALGGCAENGYYYQANSGTGQSPSLCSGDGNSVCLLAIVGAIAGAAAVLAHN